jgi:hypothetical protein
LIIPWIFTALKWCSNRTGIKHEFPDNEEYNETAEQTKFIQAGNNNSQSNFNNIENKDCQTDENGIKLNIKKAKKKTFKDANHLQNNKEDETTQTPINDDTKVIYKKEQSENGVHIEYNNKNDKKIPEVQLV